MGKQGNAARTLWWGLLLVFTSAHLPVLGDDLSVLFRIPEAHFCILIIRQHVVICLQLACLLEWGQTFVFHVVCREFELERPKSVIICQHGIDRRFCDSKVTFDVS